MHTFESAVSTATDTGLAVDHIGIVVVDLAHEVAAWRQDGFRVSDPVPLLGVDPHGAPRPLGQSSAHIVFDNFYVELSSPVPGSGNHLEPYLARYGEGVRILVLAVPDATSAQEACARQQPQTPPVRSASRAIAIEGVTRTASFRWFPLAADVLPGALSAVVQHMTPDLVFHPSLVAHPNGLRSVTGVFAQGRRDEFAPPPLDRLASPAPRLLLSKHDRPAVIDLLMVRDASGRERACPLDRHGTPTPRGRA